MFQGCQTVELTEIFDPNAKVERPHWQPLTLNETERLIDTLLTPKKDSEHE